MSELMSILAQVCGYHEGDGCAHCAETLAYRRERYGWSDEQIIEDATLFRDDRDAWYVRAVAMTLDRGPGQGVSGV